jgi:formate hydrogenlyase subunit 4
MLSIPMLFFMGAASHFGSLFGGIGRGGKIAQLVLLLLVLVVAEANAMVGTTGPGKKMLSTLNGTFWGGFVIAAVFCLVALAVR